MMDVGFVGNESPPLRTTVLGFGASFLRSRPRAASHVDNSASATTSGPNNNHSHPELHTESSHTRSPSTMGHRRLPGSVPNNNNGINSGAGSQSAVLPNNN